MTPLPIQDDGKNSEYGENNLVLENAKANFCDFNETVEIKRVIENTGANSIESEESSTDENDSSEGYNSADGNVQPNCMNHFLGTALACRQK